MSTIGAEPNKLKEGDGCYSGECYYFDGHIGQTFKPPLTTSFPEETR